MLLKTATPLLALLALAACGTSPDWAKEGAGPEQVRADQAACRASSERATVRNAGITRDIRTSIPGGRADTRAVVEDTRSYKAARAYQRLFDQCMRGLGYSHPKS